MPNKYVSQPMNLTDAPLERDFARADLQILGIRHDGASYEARVFINNPDADQATDPTQDNGYAGCFFVFGHGGCYGDAGHCDVLERDAFDPRPPHQLTPLAKSVNITGPARQMITPAEPFTITIVADPVAFEPPDDDGPYLHEFDVDRKNVLLFDRLRLVTYD